MEKCTPFSIITSLCILVCAGVIQALQGYPDALSVSFLLLGVTSVIHHSRLDKWWKYDIWRMFDYMAISVFTTVATMYYRHTYTWPLICMTVACIQCYICLGYVRSSNIPGVHACMHLIVCVSVLYLKQENIWFDYTNL